MADLGDFRTFILTFSFALPRILGLFAALPFFSSQILPGMIRMGVAVSMSLIAVPIVLPLAVSADLDGVTIAAIVVKEAAIGFILGFLVAILFWGVEAIGAFIDNQRGATMSSSMNPFTGVDTSLLGMLLNQVMTTIFFVGGGFLLLLAAIYETYALWPVGSFWPRLEISNSTYFLGQMDRLMFIAVILAAPVILAMFISELGLALISRFAPQLQVFFLAMPIKSAIAVLVLTAYATFLIDYAGTWIRSGWNPSDIGARIFE